ncbi:MAG: Na+-driven multidrug efflux protein [Firmicutes bacterium]|nr:Na+-driven multidrug efflux protein [Bacillota bacterium]
MQTATTLPTTYTRREIRSQIIHLAWPVIGEQLLTTMATMVDAILVGHLDKLSMAAIGFTQPPYWLIVGLFTGLGVGVNALVARFQGAGRTEEIESATRAGFWLALLLGAVAGVLMYLLAPWIARVAGAAPDVAPMASHLLRLLSPGVVAVCWSMVMTAALRATGDTRTSLVINVGVNVLNAALAYTFIYGHFGVPAFGVIGAGYATSTARCLGALLLMAILLRRKAGARLHWQSLPRVDWGLLKRVLRVGYVSSTERMVSTLAYIAYAIMVAKLGTAAVASHNISIAAENVSWMLASGFAMATAAMVGQRLGAGRPDQAEQVIREATIMCVALLGVLGLVFIALPGPYIGIFTNDPAVRALSASVLRIAGFTEAATGLVLTLNGALSGAGDTRPLFLVTIAGGLVRLGAAALFIFGFGWGLQGAWAAALCDWLIRAGLIWVRYRSGSWKTVSV